MNKSITYTREQFEQLAQILVSSQNFRVDEVQPNVLEFYHNENPILRLFYQKSIVACFHITLNSVSAIQLFTYISSQYKGVLLTESYYVDQAGTVCMGNDAQIAYELDLEEIIINENANKSQDITEFKPDGPVIFIVNSAMYSAHHPQAKKDLEDFKKLQERKWEWE